MTKDLLVESAIATIVGDPNTIPTGWYPARCCGNLWVRVDAMINLAGLLALELGGYVFHAWLGDVVVGYSTGRVHL